MLVYKNKQLPNQKPFHYFRYSFLHKLFVHWTRFLKLYNINLRFTVTGMIDVEFGLILVQMPSKWIVLKRRGSFLWFFGLVK